jgi:hypothetical protein
MLSRPASEPEHRRPRGYYQTSFTAVPFPYPKEPSPLLCTLDNAHSYRIGRTSKTLMPFRPHTLDSEAEQPHLALLLVHHQRSLK